MLISEIILQKRATREPLHKERQRRIDFLKDRIQHYADKLNTPDASPKYVGFLKRKIKDDGEELKELAEKVATVTEAILQVPLTESDFDRLTEIMQRPVPVVVAHIYLQDLIDDSDLTSQFQSLEQDDPAADARELIANWFKQTMPDQLYRFQDQQREMTRGELSPIHGYDTCAHRGRHEQGNAYGRY